MAIPEWGAKHTCQSCGAKYYDLRRSPVICPKCGTEFNPDALLRSRRSKPAEPEKTAPVPKVAARATGGEDAAAEEKDEALAALDDEAEKLDDLADAEDEDDELIEDASELGEDDEDMAEVLIGNGEKEDT